MEKAPWLTVYGVGGIGGILAGPLIKTYGSGVALIARGARKDHLQNKGLTLESEVFGNYTVQPETVVSTLAELPPQNLVLVCVKNGDLPAILPDLKEAVEENTILVPVMNGVSAGDLLRGELPKGTVCDSVIYVVSGAGEDYHIRQIGSFTNLFIGSMTGEAAALEAAQQVSRVLGDAGIDCKFSASAKEEIWKKYILNCAFNIVTSARDVTIGEIVENDALRLDYHALLREAWQVSCAEGAKLGEDDVEELYQRLFSYAPDSTSSLARDFAQGRAGEKDIFSKEVARRAAEHGIAVPITEQYVKLLDETLERHRGA